MPRGTSAMDVNVVVRPTPMPPRRKVSRSESMAGGKAVREDSETSPPNSVRDWSRMDRTTLAEYESIATSAATPREMDDM